MKILVTGGTGNVGRALVQRLIDRGHQVRVLGRRENMVIEDVDYQQCNILEFKDLVSKVKGMDGIIHLAAIPTPTGAPAQEVFESNSMGTFNIYQAAVEVGMVKIVSASSINALGFHWGLLEPKIDYFPIDEEHPTFTTDAYSFSKNVVEAIGDYFWRREGLSSVNLRLPAVYEIDAPRMEDIQERIKSCNQSIHDLLEMPEQDRKERVARAVQLYNSIRPAMAAKLPPETRWDQFHDLRQDPDFNLVTACFGRSNFWTSIDARDSAQALEKGLLADYTGSHALFINDAHNATGVDSEKLIAAFFPEVDGRKHSLIGTETLVSIDKARHLIGFELEYSIKRFFSEGG